MNKSELKVIGHIYNDFNEKFGIPRQSGLLPNMISTVIIEKEYSSPDAFRGIEDFSHLWLLWEFSENKNAKFSPTVRPPRLGGNKRVGVFATRSPFRPNSIGLSSVKLEEVKNVAGQIQLLVSGADILSGTPIYDIKPYIRYTDSHPDAISGFADEFADYSLNVNFPAELLDKIEPNNRDTVVRLLQQDPRPSYQEDKDRVYSVSFGKYDIKFSVDGKTLTVKDVNFSC